MQSFTLFINTLESWYPFLWTSFEVLTCIVAIFLLRTYKNIGKLYLFLFLFLLLVSGVFLIYKQEVFAGMLDEVAFLFLCVSAIAFFIKDRKNGKI